MKLIWVNHASFILESKSIRMICDPWIEGRVFNQSWEHLSASTFTYEDYSTITHIWFSHEHPDHFFPPNIKRIPAEYRKNISVLFQSSIDKKVLAFCEKMGFKEIIELQNWKTYQLRDDFSLIVTNVSNDTDSWMYLDVEGTKILNLNDCVFHNESDLVNIKEHVGEIDVLLCQFSYANWSGNKDQVALKRAAAEEKLNELRSQQKVFKPTYTIPFASFVWFCHEDNYHMNAEANSIADVYDLINTTSKCVVLYPGDEWNMDDTYDSASAIQRYEADAAAISTRELTMNAKIEPEELAASAEACRIRCLTKNYAAKLNSFPPMSVFVTDYHQGFDFSYRDGWLKNNKQAADCDISLSASSIKYCFDFEWGFDTILVAGTFEKPLNGNFKNVMEYQWVSTLNNQGKNISNPIKQGIRLLKRKLKG